MERSLSESPALTTLLDCATTVLSRPVGPGDHFLDLDGDSLNALRLVALLSQRGLTLDVNDLFEQQDMARLSHYLK